MSSGVHGMVLGLPGGGRGDWRAPAAAPARLLQALAAHAVQAIPPCNKPSSLSHHDSSHRASHLQPCGRRGQHVTAVLSPAGGSKGSRSAVAGGCRARALWGMSCGGEARQRDRGWASGACVRRLFRIKSLNSRQSTHLSRKQAFFWSLERSRQASKVPSVIRGVCVRHPAV